MDVYADLKQMGQRLTSPVYQVDLPLGGPFSLHLERTLEGEAHCLVFDRSFDVYRVPLSPRGDSLESGCPLRELFLSSLTSQESGAVTPGLQQITAERLRELADDLDALALRYASRRRDFEIVSRIGGIFSYVVPARFGSVQGGVDRLDSLLHYEGRTEEEMRRVVEKAAAQCLAWPLLKDEARKMHGALDGDIKFKEKSLGDSREELVAFSFLQQLAGFYKLLAQATKTPEAAAELLNKVVDFYVAKHGRNPDLEVGSRFFREGRFYTGLAVRVDAVAK